jgi:hypothetical protein
MKYALSGSKRGVKNMLKYVLSIAGFMLLITTVLFAQTNNPEKPNPSGEEPDKIPKSSGIMNFFSAFRSDITSTNFYIRSVDELDNLSNDGSLHDIIKLFLKKNTIFFIRIDNMEKLSKIGSKNHVMLFIRVLRQMDFTVELFLDDIPGLAKFGDKEGVVTFFSLFKEQSTIVNIFINNFKELADSGDKISTLGFLGKLGKKQVKLRINDPIHNIFSEDNRK